MNMKILPLLIGLVTLLVLSSCNLDNLIPTADINMSLVDGSEQTTSQVEIQRVFKDLKVGDVTTPCALYTGYVVSKLRVKAYAKPGSLGVDLSSFSIDYYFANGDSIPTARSESFRGTIAMAVPSGVVCSDKPSEEEPNGCTVNSGTAKFDYGKTVMGEAFIPIDDDIVTRLEADTRNQGSYASILFDGTDSNGNYYSKLVSPVTIVVMNVCQ